MRTRQLCLNAPSGAQCFPTRCRLLSSGLIPQVSMHLLVLSAFRLEIEPEAPYEPAVWCLNAPSGAQCFPTV